MSNTNVVGALKLALSKASGNANKSILSGVPVELFTAVTSYENNRDVADRAVKQAKAGGAHMNGDEVAIVELDQEVNAALWVRTEKQAAERGEAHTLPFIKVDGHTRSYGWSVRCFANKPSAPCEVPEEHAENFITYPHLFTRPESLFVTVHKGLTDDQIFNLVKEYCDGVSKANNRELQQMGMKKVEFTPTSDFVAKDSWKTAFRTIDLDLAKNFDKAIEDYKAELMAIDGLKLETKKIATHKKLSGVRAAMITTQSLATAGKWKEFWAKFFNPKCKTEMITDFWAELESNTTRPAKDVLGDCVALFNLNVGVKTAPIDALREEAEAEATA